MNTKTLVPWEGQFFVNRCPKQRQTTNKEITNCICT